VLLRQIVKNAAVNLSLLCGLRCGFERGALTGTEIPVERSCGRLQNDMAVVALLEMDRHIALYRLGEFPL
jgi:hypothetical protein